MKLIKKKLKVTDDIKQGVVLTPALLEYWHSLSSNNLFLKVLEHCEGDLKYPYRDEEIESVHAHIQNERNGGIKAWNKLRSLLLNCPYQPSDLSVTESKEEFADNFTS